jgi:hypothetical protein
MKYVKLNQSILKADHKYSCESFDNNTSKNYFIKVRGELIQLEWHFLYIFNKYMNHDVNINWNN